MAKTNELKTIIKPLTSAKFNQLTAEGYVNSLPIDQIGLAYDELGKIEKFCSDVRKLVEKAVTEGTEIPNLKMIIEEGKVSENFIGSNEEIAKKLNDMGYSNDVIWKEPELVSFTNIKKMIKKDGLQQLKDAGLVGEVKKEGKAKLTYIDPETLQIEVK